MPSPQASLRSSGLGHAIAAYLVWGLLPLYLHRVPHVPPLVLVGWRSLWTLPICLIAVALGRQTGAVISALTNPRHLAALALSAALIGGNWLTYVYAVQNGQILAASLGYYINPLVNVVVGTLFLGERLTRAQWVAVSIAGLGVGVLAWGAGATLAISLGLALSFAGYGLVRKLAPVGALPGLTIEVLVQVPFALAAVLLADGKGFVFGAQPVDSALLAGTGVVTAVPLMLFAYAARRIPYSTLGFIQFLAPTIVFVLGFAVYGEPLEPARAVSFALIWAALGVFCWDMWARRARG
jgi:chloramphenicol-sensitive protein RarD